MQGSLPKGVAQRAVAPRASGQRPLVSPLSGLSPSAAKTASLRRMLSTSNPKQGMAKLHTARSSRLRDPICQPQYYTRRLDTKERISANGTATNRCPQMKSCLNWAPPRDVRSLMSKGSFTTAPSTYIKSSNITPGLFHPG